MVRLVEDARHDDPGEVYPWELFHRLRQLIPCDYDIGFISNNHLERWSPMHQLLDENEMNRTSRSSLTLRAGPRSLEVLGQRSGRATAATRSAPATCAASR